MNGWIFYGKFVGKYTSPMDPMGYPTVLAHAIFFDSSFVSQNLSETPKPPDLLTVEFFPSPELTPDPRSYCENAEGFVASDAGRFPHPKSAQRISNAPSGSPRFLEGTENPLLQKYISYTKPMEKGTETLREFTGLLFLTFTETWGDFSIRRVTSCYIILLASRVFGILPRFNKQIHHHPKISKVNK